MDKKEIGAILKKLRIDAGFTQKEVGEKIGRSQQVIGHWETGYSQPDADTLFVLCDIYNANISDAFGFTTMNKKTGRPDKASLSTLDAEILNKLDSFLEAEAVKRHILKYLDLLAGETFVLVDGGLTPEEAEILVSRAEESAGDQSTDSHKDAG